MLVVCPWSVLAAGEAAPVVSPFPMVYVEVPGLNSAQGVPDPNRTLRSDLCEGGRLFLIDKNGTKRLLSEGFQSACEPDVSPDGKGILFSGRKTAGDFWDVWEIQADGTGLRQVTSEIGNCRFPIYLSTYYVITANEPWPLILFVSEMAGELNEIGTQPSWDLYSCRTDGSEVRRLTYGPSSGIDPFLVWDGRILFSRWQRGLPQFGPEGRMRIFDVNVDGTDLQTFSGPQGMRVQQMPTVTSDGKAVFVESEEVRPDGGGQLGMVALRRNLHTYRSLTTGAQGLFHSPSPLQDGSLLVSHKSGSNSDRYAIGRFETESGKFETLVQEPGKDLIFAQWVGVRQQPDGRSSVVNEGSTTGQIYCLDVGINGLGAPISDFRKAARRVRIAEGLPRIASEQVPPQSTLLYKRLLGELPVESDGSFFAEVPANIPIQVQLLDEDGIVLTSCDWTWVRNKEPRGCIGCHEDGELVPANRHVDAVKKPPVRLALPPGKRRSVDFDRDILPVIARSCTTAECHTANGTAPDLSPPGAGLSDPAYSERVYRSLKVAKAEDASADDHWILPGQARTSPLVWHILGKDTSRPWDRMSAHNRPVGLHLSGSPLIGAEDAARIVEWVDLGAQGGNEVADAVRRWAEYFGGEE